VIQQPTCDVQLAVFRAQLALAFPDATGGVWVSFLKFATVFAVTRVRWGKRPPPDLAMRRARRGSFPCAAPRLRWESIIRTTGPARQWRPNLIGYDALRVYGSPSYHAFKMFSTNLGDEILKATATDTEVFVSVTRDSRSGRVFVKLVNATAAAAPVQIELTGTKTIAGTATALTLAADPQATNSIDAPRNVVPVSSKLPGVKSEFTYTVPASGIVVLTLETR